MQMQKVSFFVWLNKKCVNEVETKFSTGCWKLQELYDLFNCLLLYWQHKLLHSLSLSLSLPASSTCVSCFCIKKGSFATSSHRHGSQLFCVPYVRNREFICFSDMNATCKIISLMCLPPLQAACSMQHCLAFLFLSIQRSFVAV